MSSRRRCAEGDGDAGPGSARPFAVLADYEGLGPRRERELLGLAPLVALPVGLGESRPGLNRSASVPNITAPKPEPKPGALPRRKSTSNIAPKKQGAIFVLSAMTPAALQHIEEQNYAEGPGTVLVISASFSEYKEKSQNGKIKENLPSNMRATAPEAVQKDKTILFKGGEDAPKIVYGDSKEPAAGAQKTMETAWYLLWKYAQAKNWTVIFAALPRKERPVSVDFGGDDLKYSPANPAVLTKAEAEVWEPTVNSLLGKLEKGKLEKGKLEKGKLKEVLKEGEERQAPGKVQKDKPLRKQTFMADVLAVALTLDSNEMLKKDKSLFKYEPPPGTMNDDDTPATPATPVTIQVHTPHDFLGKEPTDDELANLKLKLEGMRRTIEKYTGKVDSKDKVFENACVITDIGLNDIDDKPALELVKKATKNDVDHFNILKDQLSTIPRSDRASAGPA